MSGRTQERAIRTFMKTAAGIAFIADCIAIYLFIGELMGSGENSLPSERTISLGIVIILAFVFSLSLIRFSGDDLSGIFVVFGLVYAVFAEVILYITAQLTVADLRILFSRREIDIFQDVLAEGWGDAIFNIAAAFIITLFASAVVAGSRTGRTLAAIPYVIGSLLLIASLIVTVMQGGSIGLMPILVLILTLLILTAFWAKAFNSGSQ